MAENVFLNKLDAMVQLRPQFDHLDALGELEKPVMNPKSKAGVENLTEEPQARAVNMTAKSADVEEMDLYGDMSETARLLRAMREEPWQRLAWVDSEVCGAFEKVKITRGKKTKLYVIRMTARIECLMMNCSFRTQQVHHH